MSKRASRIASAALVVVAVSLTSGCGQDESDDGSDGSSASPSLRAVTPASATVGQCVDIDEGSQAVDLVEADCAEEHDGQIVGVAEITDDNLAQVEASEAGYCAEAITENDFVKLVDYLDKIKAVTEDPANIATGDHLVCYVEADGLNHSLLDGEGELGEVDPSESGYATTVPEGLLTPDVPYRTGPDDEGNVIEVTLHQVTYPEPKAGDKPAAGRIYAALELEIRHVEGPDDAYGSVVYPNWQGTDGQAISDVGWEFVPNGRYGSGEYVEQLPDSLGPGQYAKGYQLYEVPPKPGYLLFPFGPGPFAVAVDPPQ